MPKKQLTEAKPPVAEPKVPAPQTKRYDESFKRQAVEHWLQSDQPGTQLASELGLSYLVLTRIDGHLGGGARN